jgi:hypothetical protein
MADKDWHHAFDDPIPSPGGGQLRTLRDAANYITKLPKREHDTMLPHMGMMGDTVSA